MTINTKGKFVVFRRNYYAHFFTSEKLANAAIKLPDAEAIYVNDIIFRPSSLEELKLGVQGCFCFVDVDGKLLLASDSFDVLEVHEEYASRGAFLYCSV